MDSERAPLSPCSCSHPPRLGNAEFLEKVSLLVNVNVVCEVVVFISANVVHPVFRAVESIYPGALACLFVEPVSGLNEEGVEEPSEAHAP